MRNTKIQSFDEFVNESINLIDISEDIFKQVKKEIKTLETLLAKELKMKIKLNVSRAFLDKNHILVVESNNLYSQLSQFAKTTFDNAKIIANGRLYFNADEIWFLPEIEYEDIKGNSTSYYFWKRIVFDLKTNAWSYLKK